MHRVGRMKSRDQISALRLAVALWVFAAVALTALLCWSLVPPLLDLCLSRKP